MWLRWLEALVGKSGWSFKSNAAPQAILEFAYGQLDFAPRPKIGKNAEKGLRMRQKGPIFGPILHLCWGHFVSLGGALGGENRPFSRLRKGKKLRISAELARKGPFYQDLPQGSVPWVEAWFSFDLSQQRLTGVSSLFPYQAQMGRE